MAIVITTAGKKINHKPTKGSKFSIIEISEYLAGIVEPVFIGSNWVFVNKNGLQLKMPFNKMASSILGYSVYGLCLIVPEQELPCQFFLETEISDNLQDNNSYDKYKTQQMQHNEYGEEDITKEIVNKLKIKEEEKRRIKFIYEQGYKNLIESNTPYTDLVKNFVIFDDGQNVFDAPTKEMKINVLNEMIDFFIEAEEYEKCTQLLKLKNFVERI